MKLNIKNILLMMFLSGTFVSCEDLLNQQPPSYIIPEDYYKTEDQVAACANQFYTDVLPSHSGSYGIYGSDNNTDNQAGISADNKYATGQWKVGMSNGEWSWGTIRNINYQLNTILNLYNQGQITGVDMNIRQYIGEMYFFRAYRYFGLLQKWGDLPILTQALPENEATLVAANKRSPRNEVARFIVCNLDTALNYMSENFEKRHTRVSPDVARLVKSRVALFEASWLTNFKGTPFVPNGSGWPGKAKDYNANYQYPSGDIDAEIRYFLNIAVESAESVAEKYKALLVKNTGEIPQKDSDPVNPYFAMFGTIDMSGYPEILLWREYSDALGIRNAVEVAIQRGNLGIGVTRSLVEGFLMADGKPIYAQHDDYIYDDNSLAKVRRNRDPRISIFLKEPGQVNTFKNMESSATMYIPIEPRPDITNGSDDRLYKTGYTLRKGGTFDRALCENGRSYNAAACFRATEALLNYMEAQYLLSGSLHSGKILEYWKLIREKAGFTGDAINPNTTINATVMANEKLDWGAFTAGVLLTDPILYNIRRERRCELMAEGLRWMDLIRWRSLDQLKTENYHVEGFRLWNSDMTSWYSFTPKNYDGSGSASVSSPELSQYLRPYEKNMTSGNLFRNGYTWSMAHYLQPIPIKQFQLTASDHVSVELSSLYQNPYWPTMADMPAEQ